MALQPRRFFLDVETRQFVSSPDSTLPASDPAWISEDVEAIELYALQPTFEANQPYRYLDLSGATVKFAVGTTTPAALQTAWTPLSTAVTTTATEVTAGSSNGTNEIQKITWTGATPRFGSYSIRFPSRTISVLYQAAFIFAQNHGLYNGQIVSFTETNLPVALSAVKNYVVVNAAQDTFQVAEVGTTTTINHELMSFAGTCNVAEVVTESIAYNDTVATIQSRIVDAEFQINGVPQILVSGTNGKEITLYYKGRSGNRGYENVSIVNSSLSGAPGLTASVSYNTSEIEALISAGTTNVTLEVEISEGANRQSFRRSATLSADLISSTSPSPLPANTASSFNLQSPNGSVWTVTITNDGELQLAKQ